jgi:hypothetical protein
MWSSMLIIHQRHSLCNGEIKIRFVFLFLPAQRMHLLPHCGVQATIFYTCCSEAQQPSASRGQGHSPQPGGQLTAKDAERGQGCRLSLPGAARAAGLIEVPFLATSFRHKLMPF